MKRLSIYTTIFTVALFFASCKKVTEGLDQDPNSPIDAPADLILNGAQVSSIMVYEGSAARTAGIFSGSFTGVDRQYVSLNDYITTSGDYDGVWDDLYSRVIAPSKIVEAKALAVNNKTMAGIAQVMQAQAFGLAADLWGDVPFTEACNPTKPTPAFDTQATVYAGVQTLLDKAIVNLNANAGTVSGKDIFYGGNRAKWIAAAYTLKARYFLHVKNYASAITSATSGIAAASGNMNAPHGETWQSDFNVYYSFLTYDRSGYMTASAATLPKLLDATNVKYRGDTQTDETARFEYLYQVGLNTSDLEPNVLCDFDGWVSSAADNGFFGGTTYFPLVTFEENKLILAEAHLKKASPDAASALAALNAHRAYMNTGGSISTGYHASGLSYLPYALTDFDAAGIQNPGSLTQAEALLKEIIEEKYVTLVGQIEQFNDVRRTKNLLGIVPNTGSSLPQRFFYPQSEINSNPNTPVQAATALFTATTVNATAY
jgi:hypothetical protein